MHVPSHVLTAVQSFLRGAATGDLELLTSASLPHRDLARLLGQGERVPVPTLLARLDNLQVRGMQIDVDRWHVSAVVGGGIELLAVQTTADGARVDPRYALDALEPDDERRRAARQFYLALLTGDGKRLRDLAWDPRGVELLEGAAPPAGDLDQLHHVAAAMGLSRLDPGERFWMPRGPQVVDERHATHGIEVWRGLVPDGELPFLLRRRDERWTVVIAPFVESAVLARGGSLSG